MLASNGSQTELVLTCVFLVSSTNFTICYQGKISGSIIAQKRQQRKGNKKLENDLNLLAASFWERKLVLRLKFSFNSPILNLLGNWYIRSTGIEKQKQIYSI